MNEITLYTVTSANPALASAAAQVGDLPRLAAGNGTFAENLVEFAGRVCYRSTARMGSVPGFIAARIREGHEDILEHAHITLLWLSNTQDLGALRGANPYLMVQELAAAGSNGRRLTSYLLTGNARVWLDLIRRKLARQALPVLAETMPQVFGEYADPAWQADGPPIAPPALPSAWEQTLLPRQTGQARVTLLGINYVWTAQDHSSACFLVEGVSRSLSHQFVRHRMGSFSQESQRYVDLDKGGWEPVIPPSIRTHPQALARLQQAWARLEEDYRALRDEYGIRKEDARFLLPNATQTRFVVTMTFPGWSHFLRQRAIDPAAQWEIRGVAQAILHLLHEVDPLYFAALWDRFLSVARVAQPVDLEVVTLANGQ